MQRKLNSESYRHVSSQFPRVFSFGELGTLAKNNLFSGEVPFPKSMILTGRSIFRRISVPKVSDFWEARPFSGEFPFEESVFSGRLHFLRRVSWKLTRNFLKRYRNCLKCCLSPRKLLTPFDLEMGAFLTRFSTQSVTFLTRFSTQSVTFFFW